MHKDTISPSFKQDILQDDPPSAGASITPEAISQDAAKAPEAPEKKMFSGKELLERKLEKIPCSIDPFFPLTGLVCLAGSSDTGKSMALRQYAIAVATGKDEVFGHRLNTIHKSALVVSTEDDPAAISFLLRKQAGGLDPEELTNLRFLFEWESLVPELDAALTEQPADVVIIDCFADAYGGDLKDSAKIRAFLMLFQKLAIKHKCLFVFLHHTGKRSESFEPNKNNLLSGQGFEGKMRCVIEFRADNVRPDIRHWCPVKSNYLAIDHKSQSYEFRFDPDTFTFSYTGERTPNELLAKRLDDGGRAKYEQAKAMKDEGKTLDEIAEVLGYANKGGVSKLMSRYEKATN